MRYLKYITTLVITYNCPTDTRASFTTIVVTGCPINIFIKATKPKSQSVPATPLSNTTLGKVSVTASVSVVESSSVSVATSSVPGLVLSVSVSVVALSVSTVPPPILVEDPPPPPPQAVSKCQKLIIGLSACVPSRFIM